MFSAISCGRWGCGPCKALAPILEDLAPKYTDKVKFVKLDVDHNPSTPPKFGVRGIPTLILFKDGQVNQHGQQQDPLALPTAQNEMIPHLDESKGYGIENNHRNDKQENSVFCKTS